MKKVILSVAIAAVFASCSNNKPADQVNAAPAINSADTIGLSDYKEWKEKQEVQNQQTYTSPGVNEAPVATEPAPEPEVKQKTIVVYRDAPARQTRVAKIASPPSSPVYKTPQPESEDAGIAKAPAPVSSGAKREPYGRGSTGTEGTAGSGTTTSTSGEGDGDVAVSITPAPAPTEVPAKKDGWSKAAKGGAIGGASGAVIGAVISKNKTKGAVLGGIVGAAGGYIFGRSKDKKDGRY